VNAQHAEVEESDATNAYQSLSETTSLDDPRWAFGASTTDVPAEITAPLPDGVEPTDLAEYCLMLGDDALVYSHRLTEWVTNAPELEEEVALANTALDLLGQARALLARAGHIGTSALSPPSGTAPSAPLLADEDRLAFWRSEPLYRCVRLAEIDDNLDFGRAVARLLVFSTWRLALLQRLLGSRDPVISAIAGKGVKELAYHRDYAARWALRLGDGTDESHSRMQSALNRVWPYVDELFACSDIERRLTKAGVAMNPSDVREEFDAILDQVIAAATLTRPDGSTVGTMAGKAGRQGVHTEMLGPLLVEMQSLAREHPGATW
jgi:ring-1,2-phenylacetyl-CoA epoxidase subunit PaaC